MTLRASEQLVVEEKFEAAGLWTAARHTVCIGCDRYRVTDKDRWCRRCALEAAVMDDVASFEDVGPTPERHAEMAAVIDAEVAAYEEPAA